MMMTSALAGCIGGTGTTAPDELDDWSTYYVASAADLPNCDSDTLGRLYYVVATADFHACTAAGWIVVDLTGADGAPGADGSPGALGAAGVDGLTSLGEINPEPAGANCAEGGISFVVGIDDNDNAILEATEVDQTQYVCNGASGSGGGINSPPALNARVWDGGSPSGLVDDGDGTMSMAFLLEWFAFDMDGSIASVGIDYDIDGTIDIVFPSDSGAVDNQASIQLADGDVLVGGFSIPLETGLSFTRVENFVADEESPVAECALIIQKTMSILAIDDLGAKTALPITTEVGSTASDHYRPVTGWTIQAEFYDNIPISQNDLDWLNGIGGSTCPAPPQFTLTDHQDSLTTGVDNVATLTITSAGDWSYWHQYSDWGENWYVSAYCIDANGDDIYLEGGATYNGADPDDPQTGDTITIKDTDWGDCNSQTPEVRVRIYMGYNMEPLHIAVPIS
jgi:hypothetical protein